MEQLIDVVNDSIHVKESPKYHDVVNDLIRLINRHSWWDKFEQAIQQARKYNIPELEDIRNVQEYIAWINDWLNWIPAETNDAKQVYRYFCKFYFILDQPSLLKLQNAIEPHETAPPLTPLSRWMVSYAQAMGQFMDKEESLTEKSLQSFYECPKYNMHEYIRPHGGWKTFNQFFARNFKPGYRPVAAISDHNVIVSPADCTFAGQWEIRKDAGVNIKTLYWKIEELLEGSPYKDRFTNGIFTHSFLNTYDYHRLHTPVAGRVLEARIIQGQVYLQVVAKPLDTDSEENTRKISTVRTLDIPDEPGYQFAQTRGLFVIESPIGLVAILPMGMAQVSSVIPTAEVGVTLRKGEEIAYFQFGGSDIVVLYESASNVNITAQVGTHYKMGKKIAEAYPVL